MYLYNEYLAGPRPQVISKMVRMVMNDERIFFKMKSLREQISNYSFHNEIFKGTTDLSSLLPGLKLPHPMG